jgi:hypothetical protein
MRCGRIPERLGYHRAAIGELRYLLLTPSPDPPRDPDVRIAECVEEAPDRIDDLIHLSLGLRGSVVTRVEELEGQDFGLHAIDDDYRRLGLRRYRKAWVAYSKCRRKPVGAILAYRGPLGVDPDLLENRSELMIHPDLARPAAVDTALRLLHAAAPEYEGVLPGIVPTLADDRISGWLASTLGTGSRALSHLTLLTDALGEMREGTSETEWARIVA